MGTRGMDHSQGFPYSLAFHRLYDHAIDCSCQFDDIVRCFCSLIREDGNIYVLLAQFLLEPEVALHILNGKWLFDQFQVILHEAWNDLQGTLARPTRVGV